MPYKDRGLWRGVVKAGGKRISKAFPTKAEARSWEADARKTLQKPSAGLGLYEVSVKYLEYAGLECQPAGFRAKRRVVKAFLAALGRDVPAKDVTPGMVMDYLQGQRAKRSATACNEDRIHLLAMFNFAGKTMDLDHNPVAKTTPFKQTYRSLYTPPEEDVHAVLAVARGEELVWLRCYLLTGAREQEINRLRWEHVDFERGKIGLTSRKVRGSKMETQWIPMAAKLAESLKAWKEVGGTAERDTVFISPKTGEAGKNRRRMLQRLCERAGVRPFTFHPMRRYVGSILAKHGESMRMIQLILRHKTLAHTEKYVKGLDMDTSAAVGRLETLVESTTVRTTGLKIVK